MSISKDGAVGTADLANSAVTTAKLADSAVTTAKIADYSITSTKLSTGTCRVHVTTQTLSVASSTASFLLTSFSPTISDTSALYRMQLNITAIYGSTGAPSRVEGITNIEWKWTTTYKDRIIVDFYSVDGYELELAAKTILRATVIETNN